MKPNELTASRERAARELETAKRRLKDAERAFSEATAELEAAAKNHGRAEIALDAIDQIAQGARL